MKYVARPFVVDAEEILRGESKGDYRVTEKKGGKDVVVVMPKQEFERKFQSHLNAPHSAGG